MLSILIPTYNYNVLPLVKELENQCKNSNLIFEIICQDDASNSALNIENNKINELQNCSFQSNSENLGRGKNINSLAEKANYQWIVIMDCDMFPTTENYIKNYLSEIQNSNSSAFYGGIAYKINKSDEGNLRYEYGLKREALSVADRTSKKNIGALTSNFLIKKDVFLNHPFSTKIIQYGYEDTLFLYQLEKNSIEINHVDNPLFHLNLETSELFIEKTKLALENLKSIVILQPELVEKIKLTAVYFKLKRWKLTSLILFIFSIFEKRIYQNLTSKNPSLFLFDLYKLGFFCRLNH